ncbi:NapC/NirT family cytochrome c [Thiohalobacter sp. IOR34]|uniref:NapC/NirT family cytochrome c n=1 Tax=Thiohalobacter sp. IOR34 TaxID=3057176 RepID=UPI0025B225AE|nr:NapC/NirT family cytochrome c [Thiohalobacter sp. IOR34]WJW75953.1 NapC/NirT family cytochrome c [Thiohalobacter sp. IOR34]
MKIKLLSFTSATIFVAGILFWGGFNTAMEATNTLSFCISCHEMESTVYQEYRHSVHFRNPSGVQAACPDCHVPRDWTPKIIRKIQASVEVYHWLMGSIDTPEKFEAKRAVLAEKVWKTMKRTDSRECRNCHRFDSMELERQGLFAQKKHRRAQADDMTCIDCHKGISHRLPKETEAEAAAQTADIDLEYGEEINETCAGCHGEYGEGKPDGEYPRLAGLPRGYIAKQLRDFKARRRINIPMVPYTSERELPEEDVVTIAAYLEQIKLPTKLEPVEVKEGFDAFARLKESKLVINIARLDGNIDAGRRFYEKECQTCHGNDGYGKPAELIPPLTGQHSEYLRRQINRFRRGERLHDDDPEDQAIFQQIGDGQVQDLLSYLSILDD